MFSPVVFLVFFLILSIYQEAAPSNVNEEGTQCPIMVSTTVSDLSHACDHQDPQGSQENREATLMNDHLLRHPTAVKAELRRDTSRMRELLEEYRKRASASFFIKDLQPQAKGMIKRVCFIHSCTLVPGNYVILQEILDVMIKHDLMAQLDRTYVLNYGFKISNETKTLYSASWDKLRWLEMGQDASAFELPTITALRTFVMAMENLQVIGPEKHENMQILYASSLYSPHLTTIVFSLVNDYQIDTKECVHF